MRIPWLFLTNFFRIGIFVIHTRNGSKLAITPHVLTAVARRIGNGHSTNILTDPWLPCESDPYVHTRSSALQGQMVASLLNIEQTHWDIDLLQDIFCDRDINLIMIIPIQVRNDDTWYWKKEKLGHYTVKTAYALIQESKAGVQSSDNSGFWRRLWNLKIPAKIKHFLWSASSGCLPTKDQLKIKRVQVNELCPTCNAAPETTMHVLTACSFAMKCWSRINKMVNVNGVYNFSEWLQSAFNQYAGKDITLIVMLCWSLWRCMNEIVWNQRSMEDTEIVMSAISNLNQWISAQDKQFDTSLGYMTQADGLEHWSVPELNMIKVNTDAAIFEASHSFSYSMIARNHDGNLIEALSKGEQGSIDPEVAEAIGIREALSWIKQKSWRDVVIETDCLVAVQAIRSSTDMLSYFGGVIAKCKNTLDELKDRNVSLRFVKRSANNVAHYLARHSSLLAERRWSVDDAHSDFLNVLLKDLQF